MSSAANPTPTVTIASRQPPAAARRPPVRHAELQESVNASRTEKQAIIDTELQKWYKHTDSIAAQLAVKCGKPQSHFLSLLRSPIVHLTIGTGDSATTISAHRAILTQSPWFAARLDTVSDEPLAMPSDDLDAMGCFLQYQYTGEYFPRRLSSSPDGLEHDPSAPAIDTTGAQLLKHARVYNI